MQAIRSAFRPLTRAEFLSGAISLTAAALLPRTACAGSEQKAAPLAVEQVSDGVWVHSGQNALSSAGNAGDICNIGFIIGTSGVVVVDTGGSSQIGARLHAAVREKTPLPISHVISTHMHPDHVLGNAAFAADKPIFAGHHKLLRALAERRDSYLEAAKEQLGPDAFEGTDIVLPTLGVDKPTTIDLGGREIVLTPRPTAHTSNDLTVFDTRTETLFTGDLVFSGHLPTLDGSLRGWLKLLDGMAQEKAARIEEQFARFSYAAAIAIKFDLPPVQHCIGDAYGEMAGHVVIASASQAHGGIARPGADGAPSMLDVLG